MNRREILTGTSVAAAGMMAPSIRIDVTGFGALGDGRADDATAIQAALDHVGARGGGAVFLPPPPVHYRIGRGLVMPANVMLEGPAPVRYPFNAGNRGACALVANFTDANQWILEPRTQVGGRSVPFDQLVAGALPDGVTYNCGVKNLLITSKGKIPFGGIRMHGCPGSFVEGVSIDRVGCGLLVNYSFGGSYRVHVHALYYGVAAWDDANANLFEIYCAHSTPWPTTVPAAYRMPFMVQMEGHFVDTLKLSDDGHADRPFGVLCGSIRSTAINNVFDAVVEQFAGGIFLFNAYATDFRRCYLEADARRMTHAIVASRSRFSVQALHAYLSGTGALFDLGIDVLVKAFGSGILNPATFGKAPEPDGSSLLILEGLDPNLPGAPIQPGIRYIGRQPAWKPLDLTAGWKPASMGHERPAVRFDPWSHQVELRGTMTGGKAGACCVLPKTCRPARIRRFLVPGGQLSIGPDGMMQVAPDQMAVSLDGVAFTPW